MRENSTEEIVARYRIDVMQMARYLPWLESHAGAQVADTYQNENMGHTIPFPVYDSTLLNFVKEFKKTGLVDKNYAYVYTRNRIRNSADELKFIERADIKDMSDLAGILSRYVIEGNVRGTVWSEGVHNRVFYSALTKMKEIIEFWGKEKKDVR
ncbi:MAG: hypothetical protein K6G16_03695 [Lachnospiraceae bacterium]|nr:hypothetical protein [Lachnospiraceae bacterium]